MTDATSEAPATPVARLQGAATGDRVFRIVLTLAALSIPTLLGFLVWELYKGSRLAIAKFGFHFLTTSTWDPVKDQFGALPLIFGTLLSSLIALVIAVPLSLGVAIFLTEFAPAAIRRPIAFVVELLAAIPSVVYGLWGIFFLVPVLTKTVFPFLRSTLGFLPFFQGTIYGPSMLSAGIILAIMVMPYIMSVAREVLMLGAGQPARGGAGAGRHPLGGGLDRGGALRPIGHRGRDHPRAGPRAGRDDGGDHADRQPPRDRGLALRAGLHHGGRHRQRVLRGQRPTCTSPRSPTSPWCCSWSPCWSTPAPGS